MGERGSARVASLVVTVAVSLAALPSVASATAPTLSSKRIVIGKSIGGVAMGQAFTKARAAWGPGPICAEPDPGDGASGPIFCAWAVGVEGELGTAGFSGFTRKSVVEEIDISVAFDRNGLPRASPLRALRTAKGIGLGSSDRAVGRTYPRAVRKEITGYTDPIVDYVIRDRNRVKTTFSIHGAAQRVATITIGY